MLQFAIVFVGTTLLVAILSDRFREVLFAESAPHEATPTWRTSKFLIMAVSAGFTLFFIMLPRLVAAM